MSAPATVLIVEDDARLAATLAATLKAAGHRPVRAADAAEGLRWFSHYAPDVVLLDLGLPDRDGLSLIGDIRARGTTPIVVLSARGAETVKVQALDLGADDYVQKPVGIDELLARVRAALRHGVQARGCAPVVQAGDVEIDMERRHVSRGGEAVNLAPKAYAVLCELALNAGRPVPHEALLKAVWNGARTDIQYLRVHVGQLRRALGKARIVSVPAVGYLLALT